MSRYPKRFSLLLIAAGVLSGLTLWLTATHAREETPQSSIGRALAYDVRAFGAKGDGLTLDTAAINRTIAAAAARGGGTVHFPAGNYLSFSIRLQSNITLYFDQGATVIAADSKEVKGSYDLPEPNEWEMYQDFGHSHWQNSLIWGIGLENVAILGPGLINGKGLTRNGPRPRRPIQPGDTPATLGGGLSSPRAQSPLGESGDPSVMGSLGNKAISLKLCRNVLLRDFRFSTADISACWLPAWTISRLTMSKSIPTEMVLTSMCVATCASRIVVLTRPTTTLSFSRVHTHSVTPAQPRT
jgi:polygalacturonase